MGERVRETLREEFVRRLRTAIVTGGLRPDRTYSVPALAKEFGVSITPVREAVLDLAKDGLITIAKNKGFRVSALSDTDLDDITQLRMLLEVPAVVAQTGRLDAARLAALRAEAEAIVLAAQAEDLPGYLEADTAFHLDLLRGYGNRLLVETVTDLRHKTRLYGLDALVHTGKLVDSAAEHLELVELLAAGDAAKVEELMRRHLAHVRGLWAGAP
ncbi:MAG TPA: GntR family transcriptional regulator [Candidatus Limnocylindrales bacterium]